MTVNKVILVGNLGRDPEVRTTSSGSVVAQLSLATTERRKDRDGNWSDHTEWHRVVVFGKTAENVQRFCAKGKQLYVEGRLSTREYEKDGVRKWTTEVIADTIRFLGGRDKDAAPSAGYGQAAPAGGGYGQAAPAKPSGYAPDPGSTGYGYGQDSGDDSDIPF